MTPVTDDKPVRLKVSRMQHLHLYAAGFIDYDGKRLVDVDTLAWALERYRDKR